MVRNPRLSALRTTVVLAGRGVRTWTMRQVLAAALAALAFGLIVGTATVLIPNPVFGREIAPLAWNYPVWIITSILTGMLVATYVRPASGEPPNDDPADAARQDRCGGRLGTIGGVQPFLGIGAVALSATALLYRLRGQAACAVRSTPQQPVAA